MNITLQTLSTLASDIGGQLKSRGETIAVAESSSGGLISAALLSIPGASTYFRGGGVIYTREARSALLGLPEDVVNMRAATEGYAAIVAKAIQGKLGTTWGLCESGASGPSGNSYGDPAGHSAIALEGPVANRTTIRTKRNDREANMWRFADAALYLLRSSLS